MKKNLLFLCMALLSTALMAQTTVWTNALGTGLWTEEGNWSAGLPAEGGKVVLNVAGAGDCILNSAATIHQFVLGDNGGGDDVLRIKSGGNLTTGQTWSGIGWSTDAKLHVEKGGTVTFGSHMWAGWNGNAEVMIYGTVNVSQMYGTAFEGQAGSCYTSVRDYGVLNLANLHPEKSIPDGSFLDVTNGGAVKIKGNHMVKVQAYLELGRITANDGAVDPKVFFEITGEAATADTMTVITIDRAPVVVPGVTVWTNAAGTGKWTDAENWSAGLPGEITKVVFNVEGAGECVLDTEVKITQFVIGDNGGGDDVLRIANGGHLTTGEVWSGIAWSTDAKLIVEKGGTVTFGNHMWAGWNGKAEVEVFGTINVTTMYGTAFEGQAGSCFTSVKTGGVLNLANLHPEKSIPDGSYLDVSGGFIYITGDHMAKVQNYVELGRISANDGAVDPVVELVGEGDAVKTVISVTGSGSVSVAEINPLEGVQLYPNPATDIVYLKNVHAADVAVYSITGQQVLTQLNTTTIDIQSLRTGVYFVTITSEGNTQTSKLIKR